MKYFCETVTEVGNKEAVRNYVSKYIGKGGIDPRFFSKKRFWASHNVERPHIKKIKHEIGSVGMTEKEYYIDGSYLKDMNIYLSSYVVEYANEDKRYGAAQKATRRTNANGLYQFDYAGGRYETAN